MLETEHRFLRARCVFAVPGDLPAETEKLRLYFHRLHCDRQLILASHKAKCTVDNASCTLSFPKAGSQGAFEAQPGIS